MAVSDPVHDSARSTSGRNPETCVSKWRIVMFPLPYRSKPGMKAATRSSSAIFPSSMRIITLVVVATTFVSDARSKMVSSVISSGEGTTAR